MSANPNPLTPQQREMRQTDVPRVAAIERGSYEFPWSPGIFRDCLLAGYASAVIEDRGDVVAYAMMSVATGEAHLLNLCVDGSVRRLGYGRRLLETMMQLALGAGAGRLYLEVRASNDAALELYLRAGFERIGVRRRYYRAATGSEDAVLLAKSLRGQAESRS
ncbi:MAG: ribosomal-protein-alanine N-acetyltransferase [Gammaproteobacteria bacterium]|nr:ribosomal-protein-alanine N-acetyltransferase [Gammaproteobacteria bacterium]